MLKGVLPAGTVFPVDFGSVSSTLGEDGDPLDILVLMDAPAFAGCIVPSRLIEVIQAEQTEDGKTERNDRLLAVASNYITHKSIQDIRDVDEPGWTDRALLRVLQHGKGQGFKPKGRFGNDRGRLIADGIARAKKC